MKKMKTSNIVFLAFCISVGFVAKRAISPMTNILTDFIRIPGGSLATGFSLLFLCIGVYTVKAFGIGTLMGLTQGCLALLLGMSGYQGVFCILTYAFPGFVIDLVYLCRLKNAINFFLLSCALGNVASAFLSNFLIFHLSGSVFLLWMLMGAISGLCGGWLGDILYKRVGKVVRYV